MIIIQIVSNCLLFLISCMGILFTRQSILIILMCIELLLLSVNLNFITFSIYLDDIVGQLFSFFVLTVAASESAIGLAILIMCYRLRRDVTLTYLNVLKG